MTLAKPHTAGRAARAALDGPASHESAPRGSASLDQESFDQSSFDQESLDQSPSDPASFGAALPELETARLRLRQFAMSDADDFARITGDADVMRYIGPGTPINRAEAAHHLTRIIAAFRRRGFGKWALVAKEDGRLVGYCGLGACFEDVGVELVYLLARDCWGRGLAAEAARAALAFGFRRMNLDSIAALTKADNLRSRRLLERLGMTYVRAARYEGYDCALYSISRAAFCAAGERTGV